MAYTVVQVTVQRHPAHLEAPADLSDRDSRIGVELPGERGQLSGPDCGEIARLHSQPRGVGRGIAFGDFIEVVAFSHQTEAETVDPGRLRIHALDHPTETGKEISVGIRHIRLLLGAVKPTAGESRREFGQRLVELRRLGRRVGRMSEEGMTGELRRIRGNKARIRRASFFRLSQYSSGRRKVVADRSASVMTQMMAPVARW